MSIAPVSGFPPPRSDTPPDSHPSQSQSHAAPVEKKAGAVSEPVPRPEAASAKNTPAAYELPQDVVEVHQDPDIKGQIIIQYLDQAKNVILQVPSSQELNFERDIAQELQQAAKIQATAVQSTAVQAPAPANESAAASADAEKAASGEGDKGHGD